MDTIILEKSVRYREVSTIVSIENCNLVLYNGVRCGAVSAIKHVRYREVPLYLFHLYEAYIQEAYICEEICIGTLGGLMFVGPIFGGG